MEAKEECGVRGDGDAGEKVESVLFFFFFQKNYTKKKETSMCLVGYFSNKK